MITIKSHKENMEFADQAGDKIVQKMIIGQDQVYILYWFMLNAARKNTPYSADFNKKYVVPLLSTYYYNGDLWIL
jgi:hypothetical protein